MFGTSAGTNLGPLLFIIYMHDIPAKIFPKFADDVVSVVVESDVMHITKELQQSVDDLVNWSQKWEWFLISVKPRSCCLEKLMMTLFS